MKKFLALTVLIAIALQFNSVNVTYAAPGSADLRVDAGAAYFGAVLIAGVCNDGDETVEEFQLNIDSTTNYNVTSMVVNPVIEAGGSTAVDPGVIDPDTGIWTGLVQMGQCVVIILEGEVTGELGQDIEATFSVASSTLEGGTENVDPNSANDSAIMTPYEIVPLPDFAVQTRLLTQGEITSGTEVSYEVIYHNVGEGTVPVDHEMINTISFVVPETASFVGVTDSDPDDNIVVDTDFCFPVGDPSVLGAGLAAIEGTLVVCMLQRLGEIGPGTSFPFEFQMMATDDFVSGEVNVYIVGAGQDADTLRLQIASYNGVDPFDEATGTNNAAVLTYDNDDLIPFINRCPGQSVTTTTGNGCFRVSFNKLIWEPSFEQEDLVLTGGGTITGFTQLDDFTWEVLVSNIAPGSVVTLTLVEGGVLDYSAVVNGTQVLGENVIRFDVDANSSGGNNNSDGAAAGSAVAGTLPATGADLVWKSALTLMLLGAGLIRVSRSVKLAQ